MENETISVALVNPKKSQEGVSPEITQEDVSPEITRVSFPTVPISISNPNLKEDGKRKPKDSKYKRQPTFWSSNDT